MASSYPGGIDSFPTKINRSDIYDADHINDLQDSIIATQAALGLVLISTAPASGDATIDFTSIVEGTYDTHLLIGSNVIPSGDGVPAEILLSISASFQTSGYGWYYERATFNTSPSQNIAGDDSDTRIQLAANIGSDANEKFDFNLWIQGAGASTFTSIHGEGVGTIGTTGVRESHEFWGSLDSGSVVDGIRFKFQTGNIESGELTLFGLRKS